MLWLIGFVVLVGGIAATFVAVVAARYRREVDRRRSWVALAAELGFRHEMGDPLALGTRLGVTRVEQTMWGDLDGAQVAAITASIFRPSGSPLGVGPGLSTFSGVVAQVDPPAAFDAAMVTASLGDGEHVQVSPTGDLLLLVAPRAAWGSMHHPDDAATARHLVRRAAWLANSVSR